MLSRYNVLARLDALLVQLGREPDDEPGLADDPWWQGFLSGHPELDDLREDDDG